MPRQTKFQIWKDNATEADLNNLKVDYEKCRTKEMTEEDFRKKYGFSSTSGRKAVYGESKPIPKGFDVRYISIDPSHFKSCSLQMTSETWERLNTFCNEYTKRGMQKRYVMENFLAQALDHFGM